MNKYFLIFGIIAVMLLVGFSGCFGNDDPGNGGVYAPTLTLNLIPGDVLNASSNQNLTILTHQSGDVLKWTEMKIKISNDSATFYTLKFDVEEPNLHVMMTKGANIGDEDLFEVGEVIYFQESGGNWDAVNDFYLKIVHTPSKATLFDDNVDLI